MIRTDIDEATGILWVRDLWYCGDLIGDPARFLYLAESLAERAGEEPFVAGAARGLRIIAAAISDRERPW